MSNETIETEILRRVHIDDHFLEVGVSADNPDCVELRTIKHNTEYFGEIRLALSPRAMIELGEALVAAGNERMR